MASIASGAGVLSQSLSRGYDQKFEELICTPKRKLRLNPKVKMNSIPHISILTLMVTKVGSCHGEDAMIHKVK